jgi:K+ transporter
VAGFPKSGIHRGTLRHERRKASGPRPRTDQSRRERSPMARNASHVTNYFRLPMERVVEIGKQVSI